jgi:hypothetical protein
MLGSFQAENAYTKYKRLFNFRSTNTVSALSWC